MNVAEIREFAVNRLPVRYEPLQLTFYGEKSRLIGNYLVIGDDYGTEFCVQLDDGRVFSVDPKGEFQTRFVNSGIEQFAKFIETYQTFADCGKADAEAAHRANLMQAELEELDSAAFDEPNNWWSLILEQVKDGLI